MIISCRYAKTLYRDERSGYTLFAAKTEDRSLFLSSYGTIAIKGMIQYCPPETPLEIVCEEKEENGNQYYEMESYQIGSKVWEDTKSFLSSSLFDGIGEKKAEEFLRLADGDIFSFSRQENAVEQLTLIGIKKAKAQQAVQKINEMSEIKDIFSYLLTYGGTYEMAVDIYKKYRNGTVKKIKENPFLLLDIRIPFHLCEHLACSLGMSMYDNRRLSGLIDTAFRNNKAMGNTKMTFHRLCQLCHMIESQANAGRNTRPFYLAAALVENGYLIIKEDGEIYLYEKKWFSMEKTIAEHIERLTVKEKKKKIDRMVIEEIEKECSITYARGQRSAFSLLESPGIKILTGGPGTGKTTVINGLIMAFEKLYPDGSIRLCAPTGCAAKKMAQSTDRKAQTVHKLLDVKPYGDYMMQEKDEYDQLDVDLLIVDECSFVDTELFWMLIRAVKNGSILLLVGDEDQLLSVGPGNILHDLLEIDFIEKCRLTETFRQKKESSHYENAKRIKTGETKLLTGSDCAIIRCHTEEEMQESAREHFLKYYDREAPEKVKMFSTVKKEKYKIGTRNINNLMHQEYGKEKEEICYGNKRFSVGDPVMFCENNYKIGTFNGDQGVVIRIEQDGFGKKLLVKTDIGVIEISGSEFREIELSYAITTHKAQGSECEIAIILLPKKPANMLERSLIYVAATRAVNQNIFIVQEDALEIGIQTRRIHERKTGLKNRINETCVNLF